MINYNNSWYIIRIMVMYDEWKNRHTVISVIYRDMVNAVGFAEVHLQPCSCLINISVGTLEDSRV